MEALNVFCVSKRDFERICELENWNDNNPPKTWAVISICCNRDVAKYVLPDDDNHWFSEEHDNVLNVNFDDITEDRRTFDLVDYGGEGTMTAYGITPETADRIVRYIDNHRNMSFLVHCRAGKSRSQAVTRYIADFYGHAISNHENPCITYNSHTYVALKHARERMEEGK